MHASLCLVTVGPVRPDLPFLEQRCANALTRAEANRIRAEAAEQRALALQAVIDRARMSGVMI